MSQGLCPNATIALARHARFGGTTILTALAPSFSAPLGSPARLLAHAESAGARIVHHGPSDDRGLLVRVIGPAAATLSALLFAGERAPADLADQHRAASVRGTAMADIDALLEQAAPPFTLHGEQRLALVTAGSYLAMVHGLRWKLLEAAAIADPPLWDVLQVAHGPFQQMYARPMILCALERPGDSPLFERLERMLVPGRHHLLRFPAQLPAPWCWFEHDAQLNRLTLALLRARPLDLANWPGQGADEPLYGWNGSD